MPQMRICIRQERQPTVQQVMKQLHTSDPKVAVDWIIADWLNKQNEQPIGQSQATAAAVSLDIQEW